MATLKYDLMQRALDGITNNDTTKLYKRGVNGISEYAKSQGIRAMKQVSDPVQLIQGYADQMMNEGRLSPSTIHNYLAGPCRAFGINMKNINKELRRASAIEKSRVPYRNEQGRRQELETKNERLVKFANSVGIRRHEYGKLTPDSLRRDTDGALCIVVKGKGGKMQWQHILPQDEKIVIATIAQSGDKVFSRGEMNNKIDLHGIRAMHARECYDYYLNLCRLGHKLELIEQLKHYFRSHHEHGTNPKALKKFEDQYRTFLNDIYRHGGIYRLRGENKERALADGRPTTYDRVALMCVSVFHLAHWRNDVTVKNYML